MKKLDAVGKEGCQINQETEQPQTELERFKEKEGSISCVRDDVVKILDDEIFETHKCNANIALSLGKINDAKHKADISVAKAKKELITDKIMQIIGKEVPIRVGIESLCDVCFNVAWSDFPRDRNKSKVNCLKLEDGWHECEYCKTINDLKRKEQELARLGKSIRELALGRGKSKKYRSVAELNVAMLREWYEENEKVVEKITVEGIEDIIDNAYHRGEIKINFETIQKIAQTIIDYLKGERELV